MTVFHARDITTEETRSLFDVTLGQFLFFAEFAKAVADNHGCSPFLESVSFLFGSTLGGLIEQNKRGLKHTTFLRQL